MQLSAARDRLIVALDVSSPDTALDLVRRLRDHTGCFKVGLQLYTAAGPELIKKILQSGSRVFLDLKLHDIPNTVAKAATESARLGVHMITLHTLGGEPMLATTRKKLQEASQLEGWSIPKLLGVTVLTSMDQNALASVGIDSAVDLQVLRLAQSAQRCGLDGVVCSARELGMLRKQGLQELLFVTPGIRSTTSASQDQFRTATVFQALTQGADYLVVGRPITQAPDPVKAAEAIVEEIEHYQAPR